MFSKTGCFCSGEAKTRSASIFGMCRRSNSSRACLEKEKFNPWECHLIQIQYQRPFGSGQPRGRFITTRPVWPSPAVSCRDHGLRSSEMSCETSWQRFGRHPTPTGHPSAQGTRPNPKPGPGRPQARKSDCMALSPSSLPFARLPPCRNRGIPHAGCAPKRHRLPWLSGLTGGAAEPRFPPNTAGPLSGKYVEPLLSHFLGSDVRFSVPSCAYRHRHTAAHDGARRLTNEPKKWRRKWRRAETPFSARTRLVPPIGVGYGRGTSLKQAHAERVQRRLQSTNSVKVRPESTRTQKVRATDMAGTHAGRELSRFLPALWS